MSYIDLTDNLSINDVLDQNLKYQKEIQLLNEIHEEETMKLKEIITEKENQIEFLVIFH